MKRAAHLLLSLSLGASFAIQLPYAQAANTVNPKTGYDVLREQLSIATYSRIAKMLPGSGAALKLADIYFGHGNYPRVAQLWRDYLKYNPHDLSVKRKYADLLSWNQATRPEAIRIFKQMAQDPSADPSVVAQTGRVLTWSGKNDEALPFYQRYLKIRPNDMQAKVEYAKLLSYSKATQPEAMKQIQQVLGSSAGRAKSKGASAGQAPGSPQLSEPVSAAARLERALMWLGMNRTEDSAKELMQLADTAPYSVSRYFEISGKGREVPLLLIAADVLVWAKDYDTGLRYYKKYVEHYPKDVDARAAYARLLSFREATWPESLKQYRLAEQVDPNNVDARLGLAQLELWNAKVADAYATIKPVVESSKAMDTVVKMHLLGVEAQMPARLLAAELASANSDNETAAALVQPYLQTHPDDALARLFYAAVLANSPKGREDALQQFRQAQLAQPSLIQQIDAGAKLTFANLLLDEHSYTDAMSLAQQAAAQAEAAKKVDEQLSAKITEFRALSALGRKDEAAAVIADVLRTDPQQVTVHTALDVAQAAVFDEATRAAGMKFLERAESTQEQADLYQARRARAILQLANHDNARALQLLTALHEEDPTDVQVTVDLAETLAWDHQIDQAIQIFESVPLKSYPPDRLRNLLTALLYSNRADKVLQVLEASRAAMPDFDKSFGSLYAVALASNGKTEEAKRYFEGAVKLANIADLEWVADQWHGPETTRPLARLASKELLARDEHNRVGIVTASKLDSWEASTRMQAVERLQGWVTANPKDTKAREVLANALVWSGHGSRAVEHFDKLLAENPNDEEVLTERAKATLWSTNKTERVKAQAQLEKSLQTTFDPSVAKQLSESLALTKSEDKAMRIAMDSYEKTKDPDFLALRARAILLKGHSTKAMAEFKKVLKKDAHNRQALLSLGEINSWGGWYFEAEKYFKQARELYPNDIEVMVESAKNYFDLGRADKAKILMQKAKLELGKDSGSGIEQ